MATTLPLVSTPAAGTSTNGQFHQLWHKSAPKSLRAAGAVDGDDLWNEWARHLQRRWRPKSVRRLMPGESASLLWALPGDAERSSTRALVRSLDRLVRKGRARRDVGPLLDDWLAEADREMDHTARAIEALAWCQALPSLAGVVGRRRWWDLLSSLLEMAEQAGAIDNEERPLLRHLLAGELPLTLAYLLPELKPARRLTRRAGKDLSRGICELTDGQGVPRAAHLAQLRPLVACWTRCYHLGRKLADRPLNDEAQVQLEWAARVMLHLVRGDGTQMLCHGTEGALRSDLFRAALAVDNDPEDRRIAALVLPGGSKLVRVPGKRAKWKARLAHTEEAAIDSEWAEVNVLRPGWTAGGPRMAVAYDGGQFRCELACGRDVVWSGVWQFDLTADGQRIEPTGPWEEVAFNSDEDADYGEWEIALTSGARIQRQIVLGREDPFAYLADAILAPGKQNLRFRSTLPLGQKMVFGPADQTREVLLSGRKPRAVVLPLALGEWRSDGRPGALAADERGLHLEQRGQGPAMYCPLWLNLKRKRLAQPLTWRQLHVAQDRRNLTPHEAVGFRVQIGQRQWLIYRSLVEPANRTVLGNNLTDEFMLGRFLSSGEVRPLVQVDPGE